MTLTLKEKIIECLKQNYEKKLTARDIAEWVVAKYPEDSEEKKESSQQSLDDKGLIDQLVKEISPKCTILQKTVPQIKIFEGSPREYYYTEKIDSEEIEESNNNADTSSIKEEDLYPQLASYLAELNIYSKRIDQNKSKNKGSKGYNEWLHPDLVGMEDLSKKWNEKIKDCVKQHKDKKIKLWSFEVKIKIEKSTIRKAFFQALANSSWANFGYLVASEIEVEDMEELRMLANSHGIGFILLNHDNPSESKIMIPAKEKSSIDWNTADRLFGENEDFRNYIDAISIFCEVDKIDKSDWDSPELLED